MPCNSQFDGLHGVKIAGAEPSDRVLKGGAWFLASATAYTISNILILMAGSMSVVAMTIFRAVAMVVLLAPYAPLRDRRWYALEWPVILMATIGSVGTSICWFAGLTKLSLGTATAVFSLRSFVSYILAGTVLRERVRFEAVAGNALCITGILWLVPPQTVSVSGLLLVVGAALFSTLTNLSVAKAAKGRSLASTLFVVASLQMVILLPIMMAGFGTSSHGFPGLRAVAFMLASGVASVLTLLCMGQSYRVASMYQFVSADHLRLPLAIAATLLMASEPISASLAAGFLLILVGAGLSFLNKGSSRMRLS